jgi:broad specificity phosphatase PhoE
MRLFVMTRHAHSTLNVAGLVNGDPTVPAPLTDEGRAEAEQLGHQLARLPLDLCVQTRFQRTHETAALALGDRGVPRVTEPLLDDIDIGELDGVPVAEYRAWKRAHTRDDRFPRGESLDEAAHRYASAFRELLARTEQCVLVVCHEIPIRYALNAAGGSDELDAPEHQIPNATPYLFDDAALELAANRIDEITR